MTANSPRQLTILHFNDIYDISPRASGQEPVGGAARMATMLRSFGPEALVLFSGDAFNPSLLSTVTQGRQMVEVLNAFGVKAACVGNHDFDYGIDNFTKLSAECHFPWLMANVLEVESGLPLGGASPTAIIQWQGVRVGLIGLVEEEWLTTLASVDPDEVRYTDFVPEGRRLAAELRAKGADLVIALTHMRLPNDLRLAESAPEIDLVLGGHDHDYFLMAGKGTGVPVVKSGTDFQHLTEVHIELLPAGAGAANGCDSRTPPASPSAASGWGGAAPTSPGARPAEVPALAGTLLRCSSLPDGGCSSPEGASAAEVYAGAADASLAAAMETCRAAGGEPGSGTLVRAICRRHPITAEVAPDPAVEEIVQRFAKVMGDRMDVVVGTTAVDLDGRFSTVRTGESNLANLVCDVWREACNSDVALLNGGTLRSDRIHPAGELTHRDLSSILPMLDDTVKIQVTGTQLVAALENGVSQWPKLEGRFPQVSGVQFAFDPSQPPGHRIVPGSVTVGGADLEPDATYSLATKKYLAEGHDGYDALAGAPLLCDSDCTPLLPTVVMNHFLLLRTINRYVEATGRLPAWRRAAERLLKHSGSYAEKSQARLQAEGVSRTVRKHPVTGRWEVAPVLDGRIKRVGGEGSSHGGSVHSGSASGGGGPP
ncbi:hypothetical protein ABPG77_004834 [Micractinium sp. CCAP 211/92]